MQRSNHFIPLVHSTAATVAMLTIAIFWTATVASGWQATLRRSPA